uniref:Uncharacterized protein n=1 Tax=viral metagenome TaxID=1070528 RepID=A0A6C0J3P9_9ZZZZ
MCYKHHGNEQACLAEKKGPCKYDDGKCMVQKNNHNSNTETPYQIHLKNYLKYKAKYLNLKNSFYTQTGGNNNSELIQTSGILKEHFIDDPEGGSESQILNRMEDVNEFKSTAAKEYYSTLRHTMDKIPDILLNKPYGMVVYRNPTDFFLGHTLLDEEVKHSVPTDHIDFLYTTIHQYIPASLVHLIQSVSGSVIIDLLKNTITARCGSLEANYATLRTVLEVIKEYRETNNQIEMDKITEMYKNNLIDMYTNKVTNLAFIEIEYYRNKDEYKEQMKLNCHPYAFPTCGSG